ncbi:hypothetical protein EROM_020800 [Encephalitozoon romaleae SJ-2008]|uniref:Zinc finger PHD-type domain-containing protein n=1 Tax=Encephalitozoon romaleae (strain SJ-2008) TaxID=1178016 RepID=I7AD80_ENCRO|nr:hypothetical protein EROM_020800 [Encephalitozoon romaleae SJ-2008]AFN82555.1 hypothetical protein EROM_020800 [Encephalitozoon romaleae SJ-2008]
MYLGIRGYIRCHCRLIGRDPHMIHCSSCGNWLHTVCCGFFSNEDKRISKETFSCFYCLGSITKADNANALFRRVLSIIYTEDLRSKAWLSSRLGITEWQSTKQTRRLANEGFVKVIGKHRAISYVVIKTQETKDKVKKYFGV